jgi:hypothetical protein
MRPGRSVQQKAGSLHPKYRNKANRRDFLFFRQQNRNLVHYSDQSQQANHKKTLRGFLVAFSSSYQALSFERSISFIIKIPELISVSK